ncbi:MAG TPA: galactokinase [Marmoricola sp.]|nr:galactokinase [Marmoricola sp.]
MGSVQATPPGTTDEMARRTAAAFARRFGSAPELVGVAPGRVNLIGEHVDYAGGACLPIALRHATYAAARRRGDGRVRLSTASGDATWEGALEEIAPGAVPGWVAYAGGVLWALREAGYAVPGVDLHLESTVPLGAGLSSSAAVECAVAVAALGLVGGRLDNPTRHRLVDVCVRAETEVAGAPTGGLDQSAAMLGREAHALLVDFGAGTTRQLPFDPAAHGLGLLVIDTRVSHEHTTGGYGSRREDAEEAARQLGVGRLGEVSDLEVLGHVEASLRTRARHHVTENARTRAFAQALEADEWEALGPLMDASHASLRDDYEVSCEELDVVCATARAAGAVGARMTGGGFGGSAIALVPDDRLGAVAGAVSTAFGDHGWRAPAYLLAEAGPGAFVLPG